ncbi:MAG: aminoacyl-tRNA hydrolase [Pirellulales bacterium]|nr:aminoacyl-tRNA hydrolase [Pirellulales bacterium]
MTRGRGTGFGTGGFADSSGATSMLIVNARLKIPLAEFTFTFARSPGPGGQNVNKVNTKAQLRWAIGRSPSLPETVRQRFLAKHANRVTSQGDLLITSSRYRDAGRNVADCLEKLRAMLAEAAVAPRPRRATRPTAGSVRRRLDAKRRQSEKKRRRTTPGE